MTPESITLFLEAVRNQSVKVIIIMLILFIIDINMISIINYLYSLDL